MNAFKKIASFLLIVAGLAGGISFAHAATPVVVSAKIVGPNTVSIVFSEPVITSIGSYSNFAGVLSGLSLIGLSGSGTNTVVLTFSGGPFPGGSSGSVNISNTTVSVSDGSSFGNGGVSIIDGRPPFLTSFSVSSNNNQSAIGAAGNTITFTFTVSASIANPRMTLAGHTLYPSGSGAGPYTATYTLSQQDASAAINCTIYFTDSYGNANNTTLTFSNAATSNGGTTSSGGNLPVITAITSTGRTAGFLKVGDSITFTLVPLSATPNATVSGSYNGVPLTWTTANNGLSYTGTYTVRSGDADQAFPIQIGAVTITDANGNMSAPAGGTDVVKMISANPPYIYESVPVPSATGNPNPTYTFNSNQDGVASYGGDCISPTTSVQRGQNTVTFINLAAGLHNNCTITVTDAAGNVSAPLRVSAFTVLGNGSATSGTVTQTPPPQTTSSNSSQATTPSGSMTSSVNDGHIFSTFLGVGSTGTAVTELQKRLAALGFYKGALTQFYGSITQTAVKHYQSARKISVTGYVGPSTRAALNAE
jgi:hypothetical protein